MDRKQAIKELGTELSPDQSLMLCEGLQDIQELKRIKAVSLDLTADETSRTAGRRRFALKALRFID